MRSYGGAIGLVDGMRVGPDNGSSWDRLLRGPVFGSRHYFLHGRIWHNDPDPVYVREEMPLKHAQLICSWVAISGQLNLSSEWLPGLPAERLDVLKRTMPSHGLLPRPVDLFENDPPRLWLVTDSRRTPRRDVIGVFNWSNQEQQFDYSLDRLGLDPKASYLGFDYWENAATPVIKGRLLLSVPAQSCRIIAVRPASDHPQLLSTSRHVTQGMVDVIDERWENAVRTLRGRSKVVGNDACELRIATGGNGEVWKLDSVETSSADREAGVRIEWKQDGGILRARILSPTSREVAWQIKFQ